MQALTEKPRLEGRARQRIYCERGEIGIEDSPKDVEGACNRCGDRKRDGHVGAYEWIRLRLGPPIYVFSSESSTSRKNIRDMTCMLAVRPRRGCVTRMAYVRLELISET